jgi:hypothetical protein
VRELAKSMPAFQLAEEEYGLYEKFRPEIPPGKRGWGASGKLDLDLIYENVMDLYDDARTCIYDEFSGKGYGCASAYKSHPQDVHLIATL